MQNRTFGWLAMVALLMFNPRDAHAEAVGWTCGSIVAVGVLNFGSTPLATILCSSAMPVGTSSVSILAIAINAANEQMANRFLALGTAAKLGSRAMVFRADVSPSLNPPGCAASNCRTPYDFHLN